MWFLDTRKNRRKKPSSPQFSEWLDAQHSFFLSKKSFISKKNLEVQPPFFIGWFLNHHYFSRGLSSSKRNHLFQNGGWLPGKTCPELKNTKTTWSACLTKPSLWFVTARFGDLFHPGKPWYFYRPRDSDWSPVDKWDLKSGDESSRRFRKKHWKWNCFHSHSQKCNVWSIYNLTYPPWN